LATIEEQMTLYTLEQQVRHLLAKLAPDLRNKIIKGFDIPKSRQDLITLGARIELVDKRSLSRRDAPDSRDCQPRKRHAGARVDHAPARPVRAQKVERTKVRELTGTFDKSQVECYSCGKKGHYKSDCRSPHLWKKPDRVSKVAAGASPTPPAKDKRSAMINRAV